MHLAALGSLIKVMTAGRAPVACEDGHRRGPGGLHLQRRYHPERWLTPAWPEAMVARTAAYFWPQLEAGLSSDQRAFVSQTWRIAKAPGRGRPIRLCDGGAYLTASTALLGTEDAGTGKLILCGSSHPHRRYCDNSYLRAEHNYMQGGHTSFSYP